MGNSSYKGNPKFRQKIPIKQTPQLVQVHNFPNKFITEKHLRFFYKYGFVVIKGMHTQEQTKIAKEGAQYLLSQHQTGYDGGKGTHAFEGLPQHLRSIWGRCQEPKLMSYFEFQDNHRMCEDIIGQFNFKHQYPGPGFYTFAPRFYNWSDDPKVGSQEDQSSLLEPYDPQNLPEGMEEWSREFIRNAAELGMRFAPSQDDNWHIDEVNFNQVGLFSLLWGSFINSLPKGNMGNLVIRPGTHHVIANLLKEKGKFFHYNPQKQYPKPLPELRREGVADGNFYSVCVESGDILLAHPWLAHGIATNVSQQIRLAVYCRLSNTDFFMNCRSEMAGKDLTPWSYDLPDTYKWKGDYWANVPGINEWIKQNKGFLREYDNGRLQQALHKL